VFCLMQNLQITKTICTLRPVKCRVTGEALTKVGGLYKVLLTQGYRTPCGAVIDFLVAMAE
jgi:hypothetical protein